MTKRNIALILALVLCLQMIFTSCTLIDFAKMNDLMNNQNNSENITGNDDVTDQPSADDKTDDNKHDDNKPDDNKPDDGKTDVEDNTDDNKPDDGGSTDDALAEALKEIAVPERFKEEYTIDRQKLLTAANLATEKLLAKYEESGGAFPTTYSTDYQYTYGVNNNWTAGMYTGTYLMAYQLTGDERFADIVENHILSFIEREENRVGMDDHDIGFVFMPSCIGAYKVLGSESARDAALRAVEYYYDTGYSQEGKFIIRAHTGWNTGWGCRTMIDSQMNASLFYWAGEYLGNDDYFSAAVDHTNTTIDLILRDDGSTYHHYQFDPETAAPLYGVTWQGYADESCWARGHSWGIYGFSIAYSYTESKEMMDAQRATTYYMLNHLPEDLIPYWDYTFMSGDEELRDTSAAAIAVCGMLDMAEALPEGSAERLVYESAAAQLLEALIDLYTTDIGVDYDGLLHGVTHAKPQGHGFEECAPYADYFFMEALARYLCEDFIRPW